MYFGMITLNQNIKTEQNYATWILTALLFISKPKIFMKPLLMMCKNYKDCLFNDKIILQSQQRFKSDCHDV